MRGGSKVVIEQTAPITQVPTFHEINLSKVKLDMDVEVGKTYSFKLPTLVNRMSEEEIETHCEVQDGEAYAKMNKGKITGTVSKVVPNSPGEGNTIWVELPASSSSLKVRVVKFAPNQHSITDARENQPLNNRDIGGPSAGLGSGKGKKRGQ